MYQMQIVLINKLSAVLGYVEISERNSLLLNNSFL